MIRLAARWAFLAYIWSKYHYAIRLFLVSSFLILVVLFLHAEYIFYCDLTNTTSCNIAPSFIWKWGAILAIVLVSLALLKCKSPSKNREKENDSVTSAQLQGDGFDAIRHKAKLSSHVDQMIQRKPDRATIQRNR